MAGERVSPQTQDFNSTVVIVPRFYDPEAADAHGKITRQVGPVVTDLEKGKLFELVHKATSLEQAVRDIKKLSVEPLSNPVSERVKRITTKTTSFPIMKVSINYREADISS
jgi:phosphoribosylformylglycinamidine (FGAM) synthase PurS component